MLREQFRVLGPFGAVDSTRYEAAGRVPAADDGAPPAARSAQARAREILARRACTTCHAIDHRVIGPAFAAVAERYRDRQDAVNYLVERIRQGSVGAWGGLAMPGQNAISDEELQVVVRWLMLGAS